jgi:G3E family GTPase
MDHLFTLNELTPKIKCSPHSGAIDPALIFGLDSQLFTTAASEKEKAAWTTSNHHDEVETVTVRRGKVQAKVNHSHKSAQDGSHVHDEHCKHRDPDAITVPSGVDSSPALTSSALSTTLSKLNKEVVYRVKGFLRLASANDSGDATSSFDNYILNWAFGRFELIKIDEMPFSEDGEDVLLTVMGERGEVRAKAQQLASALGGLVS